MAKIVTATWTDPSPTTYVDHLEVWRKTGSSGTYAKISGNITLGTETYVDNSTLTDGETYYYNVRAYNSSGGFSSIEANITISAGCIEEPGNMFANQCFRDSDSDGTADDVNATLSTDFDFTILTGQTGMLDNVQKMALHAGNTYKSVELFTTTWADTESKTVTFTYKSSGVIKCRPKNATTYVDVPEKSTPFDFSQVITNDSGSDRTTFTFQMNTDSAWIEICNLKII